MSGGYRFNAPRFATWFLGLSIGLPILIAGIKAALGLDLASGGVSIIPIMLTAMNEGARYVRESGGAAPGREAWKLAAVYAGFGTMLSMLLAAVVLVVSPDMLGWSVRPSVGFIVVFAVAMFVIYTLVARVFFGLGARGEVRRLPKD